MSQINENRLIKLKESLKQQKLDAFLITKPDNIFYLTGFHLHSSPGREVFLIISQNKNLFITDGRLIEFAQNSLSSELTVIERTREKTILKIIDDFLKKNNYTTLGFESCNLTYKEFQKFNKELSSFKLVPTENIIEDLRLLKDEEEIKLIKKAAEITDRTFTTILPYIKEGVSELEIVWKIKTLFNNFEATYAFEPIVASGKGSSIPHYNSTNKKLKKGEVVLLDFGAKYQGYCSDMTRVVFLGKPENKMINLYNAVLKSQAKALDYLKTESKKGEINSVKVDEITRKTLKELGCQDYSHGTGHGVGIAIHEAPHLNPKGSELSKAMVFTIEPGVYIPGFSGVRIEDLVGWTEKGIEIFSKSKKDLMILN